MIKEYDIDKLDDLYHSEFQIQMVTILSEMKEDIYNNFEIAIIKVLISNPNIRHKITFETFDKIENLERWYNQRYPQL